MKDLEVPEYWSREDQEDEVVFVCDMAQEEIDQMGVQPSTFAAMSVQDGVGDLKDIVYDAPEIEIRVRFTCSDSDGPILTESMMVEKSRVQEAMMKRGGSFVQALGETLQKADSQNTQKIKNCFPAYWDQYNKLGREFQ